ncbi:MAG: XRE family transcriptional regulator [Cypionkella sp.]
MNADLEIARRIKQVRTERKLTQDGFAAKLGDVTRGAVGNWERGQGIKRENLALISDRFGVSFEWLATGDVKPFGEPVVKLMGYVGAAQAVYQFDDGNAGEVEAPPGASPETVAVEVRGESMFPLYEDGTILYYSKQLAPEAMTGKRCIVKLEDDRVLVKGLRRGSAPGLYTLVSLNAPDIEDVALVWAAPIDWIKPR